MLNGPAVQTAIVFNPTESRPIPTTEAVTAPIDTSPMPITPIGTTPMQTTPMGTIPIATTPSGAIPKAIFFGFEPQWFFESISDAEFSEVMD